jgi:hypothetical protein
MPSSQSPNPGPLLSIRAAVVLLVAAIIGLIAGMLGFFAYGVIATAVLVGGGAAGGAAALFHGLLDR